jgi:hypothetical protein
MSNHRELGACPVPSAFNALQGHSLLFWSQHGAQDADISYATAGTGHLSVSRAATAPARLPISGVREACPRWRLVGGRASNHQAPFCTLRQTLFFSVYHCTPCLAGLPRLAAWPPKRIQGAAAALAPPDRTPTPTGALCTVGWGVFSRPFPAQVAPLHPCNSTKHAP